MVTVEEFEALKPGDTVTWITVPKQRESRKVTLRYHWLNCSKSKLFDWSDLAEQDGIGAFLERLDIELIKE